jgi:DNA invertase Pin-like site-specific DNA recombinase
MEQKKLRCVFYVRISTLNHHQTVEPQLNDLRPFAESRGWDLVETYTDTCSGKKDKRPELNRLMADAKQRKFDVLCVWKLDRFARSLAHLVTAIAEFQSLGIAFVSLKDNIDLSTASGRLMFQIIGAMAEFEHSLIVERVNAGLRNARAKGKVLGRRKGSISQTAASRTTLWRRKRAEAATAVQ